MDKNRKKRFKFQLSWKIYSIAIIVAFIFATTLSFVLYCTYYDEQIRFVKISLKDSTNSFSKLISERYEKISLSATDMANMAEFMYNNKKLMNNFSKFYTFMHFKKIGIYDKEKKIFLGNELNEIDLYKMKKGLNYKIKNGKLEVYYLYPVEEYFLVMSIDQRWLFKLDNSIANRNFQIGTVINILPLNKSYIVTETGLSENKVLPLESNLLKKDFYVFSENLKNIVIYSFVSKKYVDYLTKSEILHITILIYLVSFAVTIFLVFLVNVLFVRKVKKIVSHISRIKNGELELQIELEGNDEIAYLAHHINSMTNKLSQLIKSQRGIIDEKTSIISKKLAQEKEINNLIINMTQNSDSVEVLLKTVHDYLKEKGAIRFFHYRIGKERNAFELLENYGYPKLPKKFLLSSTIIQEMFSNYEKGEIEKVKKTVRKLCNTENEKDIVHIIDYENKFIGFLEIEWKNPEDDSILIPILKTLPIILNNIYMRDFLLKTTKDLQEANKAKTEFLNIVSHELRTPLNAILGFTQILLRRPEELSKKQLKYLKNIYTAGNNLLEIINDILDLSKIQSGKREIHISEINVKEIVDNIVAILKPLSKEKNIDLQTHLDLQSEKIYSDENAIKHIITNLLSNAIKYTENGGRVDLDLFSSQEKLTIKVKDTGIGIPEDKISYIFEPFKRLQKDEYASNMKGTGLGLSIVKEYVDILGGSKKIKSKVGVGTTFEITLPIKKIEFPKEIKDGECEDKILIIENDENDIELYKNVLEASYKIEIAKTLQDGVNTFENSKPKIIILDLRLPDMSGVYLLNKLNEDIRFKCTNIVVSSVLEKKELPGIKFYIQKPIRDLIKFQETIEKLMNS